VKKPPVVHPWHPAPYDDADTYAVKALAAGVANEGQQKRALEWIINTLCGTYDLSFRPGADGDRETAFAEGKRHIGLQLVKQVKLILK
jgi:hypothetical protein